MQAIGADKERIKGSIRFSLSDETKKEELDEVLRILPQLTGQLRSLRV
jgi:cysteine sulfinate desulfinase/cysteine desulfurase-like protein